MSAELATMAFQIRTADVSPAVGCFRPAQWPPAADWVVSLDVRGDPLSLWSDGLWDFSPWVGKPYKLDFAGGRHQISAAPLGDENQNVLRLLTTWLLWGPGGAKSWHTLQRLFFFLRRIIVLCETQGILAAELARFPLVLAKVPSLFSTVERDVVLLLLDRLQRNKQFLGFSLLDEFGVGKLAKSFAEHALEHTVEHEAEQAAYIPPRIWYYQNRRLRECLDDFISNQNKVRECYEFCVDAYIKNYGSLEAAVTEMHGCDGYKPFTTQQKKNAGSRTGREFHGAFIRTAEKFGIDGLLARWMKPTDKGSFGIRALGAYLNLIQIVSITYIANFTLQRKEEAGSLRTDCLNWENDESIGGFAIICGETTKTDPDSDARWPTSPQVEIAVRAAGAVAKMRMRCIAANIHSHCGDDDIKNPYLYHYSNDPWSPVSRGFKPYQTRPVMSSYRSLLKRFPLLMNEEVLKITEDDIIKARMFTPNLDKGGQFAVGKVWPLAFHQLRRTGAINMFASGLLSDSSIQVVMKHINPLQTRYYGRNYSRMNFNEEAEGVAVAARYEVMGRQIAELVSERYVSPLGEQRKQEIVVNLVSSKDFSSLVKAGKSGEISFRETRLGGCTKRGHCDYGGIEAVARCSGGDGGKPCREAIYDKEKRLAAQRALENLEGRIESAKPGSPRKASLESEAQGLRNYLNVTSS